MIKNIGFFVFFNVFATLPGLAAEFSNKNISLEHIDSALKLQEFKKGSPNITEDILEEGYQNVPEEWEIQYNVSQLMKQYPVWGMWLIIYEDVVVGRITLYKPTAINERSEIFTWIRPQNRGSHIGREARQKLYQHLLPFVGNPVTTGEVQTIRSQQLKVNHIANFRGILSEIAIDNYASLISQIRSGARVYACVGEEGRVSVLKLCYPPEDLSARELELDKQLQILKTFVEPAIVNQETRDTAVAILKSLERGKSINGILAQFEATS